MTKTVLWSSSQGDIPADLAFKNNFAAGAAPTANDDANDGYTPGSVWVFGGVVYTCTNATAGAAVWGAGGAFTAQGAPVAKTTSSTLTAANLLAGMITVAQGAGANSNQALPTGTAMQSALPAGFGVGSAFDFSIVNTGGASETATLTVGTNFTIVGGAVVQPGASATFRVRKTADNTFVAYRIAG
ncbi:hypothetical protein [Mesorhizobium amorphae]|uniref:hypothetical protein n=1 Tax=Mesorhizobium amorphae TaxID=71433 RepID=UPI001184E108|nr:hypothetical protein [Mesorhizobium amorphae]